MDNNINIVIIRGGQVFATTAAQHQIIYHLLT